MKYRQQIPFLHSLVYNLPSQQFNINGECLLTKIRLMTEQKTAQASQSVFPSSRKLIAKVLKGCILRKQKSSYRKRSILKYF